MIELHFETFGPMKWSDALTYCQGIGDGWRLPTRAELVTAYDTGQGGFQPKWYWSSTTYRDDLDGAWYVDMNGGFIGVGYKGLAYMVRAVRDVPASGEPGVNVNDQRAKSQAEVINVLCGIAAADRATRVKCTDDLCQRLDAIANALDLLTQGNPRKLRVGRVG